MKKKLQAIAFNCGFLITTQLTAIYTLKEDIEFIRLTREYYSLRYKNFDFITYYLTYIKSLKERIRETNVILDDDKQILLCFDITLSEEFQYFIKIWAITPRIITNKTRNILLKEERRRKTLNSGTVRVELIAITRYSGKRDTRERSIINQENDIKCSRYEKPHENDNCWRLYSELAPEWLQER